MRRAQRAALTALMALELCLGGCPPYGDGKSSSESATSTTTGGSTEDPRCLGGEIVGVGGCDEIAPPWRFNVDAGQCEEAFVFGCEDGPLLFYSEKDCVEACGSTTSMGTTGSSSTGPETSNPLKVCEESQDEAQCGEAIAPRGLGCAWLEVFHMSLVRGVCTPEHYHYRCVAVDWSVGDDACVAQYEESTDIYYSPVDEAVCPLIKSPGWSWCWDNPDDPFCTCLTGT